MRLPVVQRRVAEKAEVGRSRLYPARMGAEFRAGLMQVDLLRAKAQRKPGRAAGRGKAFDPHPKGAGIEIDGGVDIRNSQDKMVQRLEFW